MALLDKLKQTYETKSSYNKLQHSFYDELFARFPHIFNSNMADMANVLQQELVDMLCLSLKYRSIKIPLKARARYSSSDNTIVNVQRGEPGFYYPQSQRGNSDISYFNISYYINDTDDLWCHSKETDYNTQKVTKEDRMVVCLSDLKQAQHAPRVHAEKLDAYFKFLREVMAYKHKFLAYTGAGISEGIGNSFKVDKLKFTMLAKSFNVNTPLAKSVKQDDDEEDDDDDDDEYDCGNYHGDESNFRYEPKTSDVIHLLDYSEHSCLDFGELTHEKLKLFIDNYGDIRPKLEAEEARKKIVFETCTKFVDALRVHTVPFRVLGEITQK